jgi:thioredoxin
MKEQSMFDVITDSTFNDFLNKNENVIVYFWAVTCGACKAQDVILNQIIKVFPNKIKIAQIDVNKNPALSFAYQIQGTPTILFFKRAKIVRFKAGTSGRTDRLVGARGLHQLQGIISFLINMKIMPKETN